MMDNKMKLEYIDDYLKMENGFRPNLPNEVMNTERDKFLEKWHDNIPSKLYHYMPFSQKHHVKSLIDSKLWFSYPQYFNDPNDSRVISDVDEDISCVDTNTIVEYFPKMQYALTEQIKYNQAEWGRLSQKLMRGDKDGDLQFRVYFLERILGKQYATEHLLNDVILNLTEKKEATNVSAFYNSYKKLWSESVLEAFDKEIAICSFSMVHDNMLMWSHYSDQHKGLCLEYNINDITNEFGVVFPAVYGRIARYTDLGDLSKRDKYIKRFLFKSKEWEYEKEWRALLDTRENCHSFHADLRGFLSRQIKPAKIYVGNNMGEDDIAFIKARCDEMEIDCYKMRIKEDSWEFDEPVRCD
ncbi:DUF2971 domain-containing protein [Selenomonas sp. KH1T6]|uniref:DUF2971 domain-containing protein n=1 Tax=Selenomonas sp. KH1T6 TaxID=3158784 RepID=UPI0008A80634|nr:Protein of unknown function [Selenomonas ruminantium]